MLLTLEEVARRLGVSRMTVHTYRADPAMKFPLAVQVTKRGIFIVEAELNEWIAARPRTTVRQARFTNPLPLPAAPARKRATASA